MLRLRHGLGDAKDEIGVDCQADPPARGARLALYFPPGSYGAEGVALDGDVVPGDRPGPARLERLQEPDDCRGPGPLGGVALVDLDAGDERLEMHSCQAVARRRVRLEPGAAGDLTWGHASLKVRRKKAGMCQVVLDGGEIAALRIGVRNE
jgi:hypothetical protein